MTETLLDEMRDGRRQVTREGVDVLLHSVDVLRMLLNSARDKTDPDQRVVRQQLDELEGLLGGGSAHAKPVAAAVEAAAAQSSGWHITFIPHTNIMQTGNAPLRIVRELAALGDAKITTLADRLPALDEINPENCYLGWQIELKGDIAESQLKDIFLWVEDECELDIKPMAGVATTAKKSAPAAMAPKPAQPKVAEETEALGLVTGLGYSRQDRSDGPSEDGISWLLGANYALGGATTLRDLYAADRGNPDLEPETTDTFELGWHHDFATPGVALEAVLFHIEADDFIERIPGGVTQNFEAYRFQGLELSATRRNAGPFGLSASYTYTDSENQSSNADTTTLQNRPEHKFALRADYEFRPGLRAGGTWLYVADSYALSRTTPTTALKLDDYNVLDLVVSLGLGPRGRVFARVENALDELYEESFGFPQAGRTFVLGAEFRL